MSIRAGRRPAPGSARSTVVLLAPGPYDPRVNQPHRHVEIPLSSAEILAHNEAYVREQFAGMRPLRPARHMAVVACMDSRMGIFELLGLGPGEAHIIRNAGGLVTDDALRSLIISHKLLGTETFFVIEHTDCGMLTFQDAELQARLREETGQDASGIRFGAFSDVQKNVGQQVQKIKDSPFLPGSIDVHGFVYDVKSGKLSEVK